MANALPLRIKNLALNFAEDEFDLVVPPRFVRHVCFVPDLVCSLTGATGEVYSL